MKIDLNADLGEGCETALAYAIAHVLQRDGLLDQDYLDRHSEGAAAFLAEAAQWTPARAAAASISARKPC